MTGPLFFAVCIKDFVSAARDFLCAQKRPVNEVQSTADT